MKSALQSITSECPVCSGKEFPTGRTEVRDTNHTYVEFQCQDCKSIGWEWSSAWQDLLKRKNVLIIKNITREGPGLLEIVLKDRAVPYTIIDISRSEPLPAPAQFSAVVVLGGPDSANDETKKMQTERVFVKTVLDKQIPYLGICLGLQVLVKVAGGTVNRSPVKEVGFTDPDGYPFEVIMCTQVEQHDALFRGMGENFRVFQLHGETVKLTSTMQQLAVGRLVKNQIVKIGNTAYGIQCHFELTAEMFEQWISEDPNLLQLDKATLRSDFAAIQQNYTRVGRQLFENFLNLAGL